MTRLHLFFFPFYELQQISRETSALVTTRTASRLISLLWSSLSNGNAKPPLIFLCLSMRISIPLTFLGPRSGSFSEANSEDLLHFFILSTAHSISVDLHCATELLISRWNSFLCKHGHRCSPVQQRCHTAHVGPATGMKLSTEKRQVKLNVFNLLLSYYVYVPSSPSAHSSERVWLGDFLRNRVFRYKDDVFSGFWHRCVQISRDGLKNTAV